VCKVLDWELGERESAEDWGRLLARLCRRQLWRERGLRLFIHDGDPGLKAALTTWYWNVPSQRCVFHKLRNVWQAIAVPDDLAPTQQRQLKQRLIRQAAAVFKAADDRQARHLLATFKEQWQDSQPEAVAVLHRDLEDTLRFYAFLRRCPDWRAESLRTTSVLERINRKLRHSFRTAGAYNSPHGLLSSVARVLSPLLIS
jgi:putative transposase